MQLGEIINDGRVNKHLGLRALARKLDIAPSYLSDIEKNHRVPSEEILYKIAKALDLDFDILMWKAGRLGGDTERYIHDNEFASRLFRRIAELRLDRNALKILLEKLDQM